MTTDPGPCGFDLKKDDLVERLNNEIARLENGEDHDEGAFDSSCEVCVTVQLLREVRAQLAAAEAEKEELEGARGFWHDEYYKMRRAKDTAETKLASARKVLEVAYNFLQDKSFTPDALTHECTRVVEQLDEALRSLDSTTSPSLPKYSPDDPRSDTL